MEWQTMDTAPRDGTPILGWCDHEADPYYQSSTSLTLYGAHVEGMSHVENGIQVIQWGGGWNDSWEDGGGSLPDWWFRCGSEFEEAANPTHWMPLPPPPTR